MTKPSEINIPNLSEQIRGDLGLNKSGQLDESYVAMIKKFNLTTELLSPKAKSAHIDLYKEDIEQLNKVSAQLDTANRLGTAVGLGPYRALKFTEVELLNSVYLHELYFANISDPHSQINMNTLSYMRLERDFGKFDDWQFDMIACAMSAQNGWAVTGYSTFLQRFVNFFMDGDKASMPVGMYPVIVIDVHEHAYFRDYLNDRKAYVYAMMKELRWDVIEERFKRADGIAATLR